jgi:hypothetical protein
MGRMIGVVRPFLFGEETTMKGGAKTTCRSCRRWEEVKHKMRIAEILEQAAESFAKAKRGEKFKPTLTEYLKLVQLEKEFEEEEAKEIRVRWVSPTTSSKKSE